MDVHTFEKKIDITFRDQSILETAFTHRSYLNEHRDEVDEHNERLEFLGDAVLELVVTDYLFRKYPDHPEGDLTAFRAGLVNTTTLSRVATKLGINDFLRLSKGEAKDTGRARQYILANTFEAIVGAIYLDQEYDAAQDFIARVLFPLADNIVDNKLWQDAKSRLQELAQEHLSVTPTYTVLSEKGPDHDRRFMVGVVLGEEQIATGEGMSKQEAEQEAAQKAIEAKGW